jgi:hypothetical protein
MQVGGACPRIAPEPFSSKEAYYKKYSYSTKLSIYWNYLHIEDEILEQNAGWRCMPTHCTGAL